MIFISLYIYLSASINENLYIFFVGKRKYFTFCFKILQMKKFIALLSFSFLIANANAQQVVSIDSLENHLGETVTVCSKVYGTRFFENSKRQPTFLNLGASYPNSPLTVVIFSEDRPKFKRVPEILYERRNVCVTGKLETYKNITEIIVNSPDQIVIQK